MRRRKFPVLQLFIGCLASLASIYVLINFYTSNLVPISINLISTKSETTYREWQKIAAYPWLFPHHPSTVLFSGLHNDLEQLLMWMSNKTNKVALLRFSYPWQRMLQNQIYTLVKFGQACNYVVMVGDEKSLQACFELNLPCFNGTKYYKDYYKDIDPTVDALFTDKKHFKPMNWFKLRFYHDVLIRNYTILACDTDIAYGPKNIWLSLERYSESVGNCDMIFMQEAPVNAGFFYSRSNNDTIALFKEWIITEKTLSHLDEQQTFGAMRGYYYEICDTKEQCRMIKEKKMKSFKNNSIETIQSNFVSLRRFPSIYHILKTRGCPTKTKVDPCQSGLILVHPICTVGQIWKIHTLKLNGFWLLQESCDVYSTNFSTQNKGLDRIDIYRCKPIAFADPLAERDFEKCDNDIAWMK